LEIALGLHLFRGRFGVRSKWIGLSAAVLCLATAAQAQVEPSQYAGLQWRSIGPFRGGRALTASGVPGQPDHFYFGSVNGGVWESLDAGRTWKPIFDSAPVGSIGALAVAPSAPNVLYVGTGEADMRSDIAQGQGVFKSLDGGKSWSSVGLQDTQQIGKILVDPRNPEVVLVAALGHPYGPNAERGVFRSEDGGKTWTKTLYRGPDVGAIDLAFEPGHPDVVYASLWSTRRPPWNVYPPSSGPGGGLWKSTDGGRTWSEITGHGLPANPGHIGIATAPSRPERVYALVDAKQGGGLYRSDDAGGHFTKINGDGRIWERGWYFGGIVVEPKDADTVYVSDVSVYRSTDGGKSFAPVKGAPGGDDYHFLWIDPDAPNRRILAADQGTVVSLDGGATWSSWFNQPTGQFYHVMTDNRFPYWVYGAQQDSGAAGVPSRNGSYDGINITQFKEVTAGGESDNVAPDPEDPDTVFGGRVDKFDLKTGQTRDVDPTLAEPDVYRRTWTLPLVFSKRDPKALYFGNQRIFRTRDGGEHWAAISPDLTRANPGVPANLDPATAADDAHPTPRKGVVYAIGPSPVTDGLIWAGTDDGLVWKSADDGAHWTDVTPKGLQAWSKIGVVEPSRFDPETAYLAVDRHRLDDFRPYVYRTHDGGRTWTLIAQGLDAGGALNTVNVVREDPARKGLLYAGTERGVFVSFDDGERWEPLQANLPRTSVRDIDVHGDDLVIATHGRGFWILDDLEPLRELAADPSAKTRLFAPAVAYRARPWGFTGSPMPKDEPRAPNPPSGALIDYYLPQAAAGPVELTVLDAQGRPVRHYTSSAKAQASDVSKLRIAPDWIEPTAPPSAAAGLHRFVWDLHYAKPKGEIERGDDEEDAGVWAPPGRYQIELKVAGQTWRQPLELKPDPRIKADTVDYAAEFDLARRIEAVRVTAAAALNEARELHKKLVDAQASAPASRRARLKALDAELVALTDVPTFNAAPGHLAPEPSSVKGLPWLNAQLAGLARATDGADAAPSPDVRKGFEQTSALLDQTLAKWAPLKAKVEAELK
jgi:photosystem II stability/assembly factor-like uncharacterized protein